MRWLLALAVVLAAGLAGAEPRASNPAFVGIKMSDVGFGCRVDDVVAGGPAKVAGLRAQDVILAIDDASLLQNQQGSCTTLVQKITAHAPGDTVRIQLHRGIDTITVKVALSTRAEVLHRRFVGHSLASATLSDADDPRTTYEIDDLRGHVTVLGWFHADTCVNCGSVFDRVRDGLRERLHGEDIPTVLAVTPTVRDPSTLRKVFTSSVKLATAPEDAILENELLEGDRIHFLIIDAKGIVRFVSPIAPDSDDIDAALDEVLAACEQEEHAAKVRR
ncbi:MAG: PDZ domain-containing protein [Deltaproteobacteria bacterium]|nr:PDZ domain-containing protein [Deltaproteobacteria bacterium]